MSTLAVVRRSPWKLFVAGALLGLAAGPLSAQKADNMGRHNMKPPPRPSGPAPSFQPKPPWRNYAPKTAKFRKLDKVIGPFVNLNVVPFSPIAVTPGGDFVAAVNTHANLVRIFDSSDPNPANWQMVGSLRTAWGPVSCAFYNNPTCVPELLVTCSNSDSLLWLSYGGRVEGLLGLPGEPSDLLVDQARDRAWVSCMGADVVVEIDLLTKRVVSQWPIPSKHPSFLQFESGNTGSVIVVPRLSGNNTTVERGGPLFNAGPNGILDLSTATLGLPDEDLFRLDPAAGTIEPLVIAAGTVLFEHGENPVTGEWWMLGTDAKNFQFQSEPEAQGIFSENRLAIVNQLPAPGQAAIPPSRVLNLDDSNPALPGVQYNPTRTVGQPHSLAFDSAGNGYITGMLTNNVTQLNAAGNFVQEWNVGSIPRALQFVQKGPNEYLAVYCWGSNKVEIYLPALGTGVVATLDLGPDPAHADIKAGRAVYYSALNSAFNNQSCNTCHVDGFSDMIAWDLSDRRPDSSGNHTIPVDDKGPLVTQTLRTIKGQNPYHWRGERADLIDFNGAFPGLLGGAPLDTSPGGAFEKFQTFIMSLHERANPFESVRRVVSDKLVPDSFPKGTSAVRGQDLFFDKNSLPTKSCEDCHTLPGGTSNDTFRDEGTAPSVRRSHFVVAPLLSFWRKIQPTKVPVEYGGGIIDTLPTLGVGLAATGLADDMQDFVLQGGFLLDLQEKHDVAAFMMQLDTGIAPLMHKGVRVGYGSNCGNPALPAPPSTGYPATGRSGTAAASTSSGPSFAVTTAPTVTTTSVQPGIAPGITDEQTANAVAINLLVSKAKPDDLELVVVAELTGQNLTGVYDPDTKTFGLQDDLATTVNLTQSQLLQQFNQGTMVGMIFPMPQVMGQAFSDLDPDDGTPAVIPGPGPIVPPPPDPGDEGDGSKKTADGRDWPYGEWAAGPKSKSASAPTGVRDGGPKFASSHGPTIRHFEVVYATRRVAKLVFFTETPTSTMTEYTPEGGSPRQHHEPMLTQGHMVFLRDLDPDKTWDLRIEAQDALGNVGELVVEDAFETMKLLQPKQVVVDALSARAPDQDSGGTLRFTVDVGLRRLNGNPPVNFAPAFDVLVKDSATGTWREDQLAVAAPGTDNLGLTFIEFIVNGLNAGDEVLVVVDDIADPVLNHYVWSFPDTPSGNRDLTVVYTGTGP